MGSRQQVHVAVVVCINGVCGAAAQGCGGYCAGVAKCHAFGAVPVGVNGLGVTIGTVGDGGDRTGVRGCNVYAGRHEGPDHAAVAI